MKGFIRANSFTKKQVEKDAALRAIGKATATMSVAWHFFPDQAGRIGIDDEFREQLDLLRIPYIVHAR